MTTADHTSVKAQDVIWVDRENDRRMMSLGALGAIGALSASLNHNPMYPSLLPRKNKVSKEKLKRRQKNKSARKARKKNK